MGARQSLSVVQETVRETKNGAGLWGSVQRGAPVKPTCPEQMGSQGRRAAGAVLESCPSEQVVIHLGNSPSPGKCWLCALEVRGRGR